MRRFRTIGRVKGALAGIEGERESEYLARCEAIEAHPCRFARLVYQQLGPFSWLTPAQIRQVEFERDLAAVEAEAATR